MSLQTSVLNSLKNIFIKSLNNLFPSELQLGLSSGVSFIASLDSFGAIEENIFYNVYFNQEEISSADTIIDLGGI